METVPEYLQWGALGILLFVLAGVGKFLFDIVKTNIEHTQKLATKAVESLEQTVKENTEAQVMTRETLVALVAEFKACDTRARGERREIMDAIGEKDKLAHR